MIFDFHLNTGLFIDEDLSEWEREKETVWQWDGGKELTDIVWFRPWDVLSEWIATELVSGFTLDLNVPNIT